jgi:hypothetical protein
MDGQRFDLLARAIARGGSRRQVLKGLAGGALAGGFLGAVRAPRAAAQDECVPGGGSCETGDDCCSGLCNQNGICYCTDPSRPPIGCPCTTGTDDACGDTTLLCCPTTNEPGGPGICTSGMVGCNPLGCHQPGESCEINGDCCQGQCSDEGVCYCTDPDRPGIGCSCTTGTENPCGDTTLVCCATSNAPGGPGICTSGSVGCEPVGCSGAGDPCGADEDCCAGTCGDDGFCFCEDPSRPALGCPCTIGRENACGDTSLVCCTNSDDPNGFGICTSDSVGCEPTGGEEEGGEEGGGTTGGGTTGSETTGGGTSAGTTLPSTGAGMRGGDDTAGRLAPLALLGAGAALVGRRLRGRPSSAE